MQALKRLMTQADSSPTITSTSTSTSSYFAHTGISANAFTTSSSVPRIIDSGASDHMTSCSSIFNSYLTCSGKDKELKTGKVIGSGKAHGGLYFLESAPHSPMSCGLALQADKGSALSMLHQWHPYLINRMPSNVINFKTPIERLPSHFHVTNLSPRVFGCLCFVHALHPLGGKFGPKAHKCVFIGYSPTQKGYKYYDPSSGKFWSLWMSPFGKPSLFSLPLLHLFRVSIDRRKRYFLVRGRNCFMTMVRELVIGGRKSLERNQYLLKEQHVILMVMRRQVPNEIEEDVDEILNLKSHLVQEFEIKNLRSLRYFLGMEVARSDRGIFISQRKYILDLLEETGMLGCRPVNSPIEANHHLSGDMGERTNKERYQRIVGRLIYLAHMRPDVFYAVSVVNQFMHDPRTLHLDVVYRILRHLKSTPGKGILFLITVICSWSSAALPLELCPNCNRSPLLPHPPTATTIDILQAPGPPLHSHPPGTNGHSSQSLTRVSWFENLKERKGQSNLALKPTREGGVDVVTSVFSFDACKRALAEMVVIDELPFREIVNANKIHKEKLKKILEGLSEISESILRVRDVVRYVRSSPQRLESFKKCVEKEKLDLKKNVCLDVSTRWNSTYLMLDTAEKFEKAFQGMAEEDNGFQTYFGVMEGEEYEDGDDGTPIQRQCGSGNHRVPILPTKLDWKNCRMSTSILVELCERKENPSFDILLWWKTNSNKYPILAQIALDVLALPVSTVASESAFSTGGRILDPFRSSLSPSMVKTLVCTQNWLLSTVPINLRHAMDKVEDLERELLQEDGQLLTD
ncbi:hypothetical protein Acr_24g0006520 [Actinidia rufa]|uniref:Uncharacterized protein n=1 Tax=Actinidia rufa TaxID=165716 RepID=A0A7J0GUJ7_9ERIC|nr:hypothetical protein Acr_24g0006520 [Actinidia rufa]